MYEEDVSSEGVSRVNGGVMPSMRDDADSAGARACAVRVGVWHGGRS